MEDSASFIQKMMELGIGMSMIRQMPAMVEGVLPNPASQPSASVPPAVQPSSPQYYMVVDNAQAGPFCEKEMIRLIQNDLLHRDSLVWREGLAAWSPASQIPEVNKLFVLAKMK